MTVTVDEFLEHHGVKGMRWGKRKVRNESERKKTFGERSGKQKAAIIGVGAAAGLVGVNLLMRRNFDIPFTALGAAAATVGGMTLAEKMIDRHGNRKLSEIS